jgi:gamma-glutamyltranspeptidase/glutathione hydrolase
MEINVEPEFPKGTLEELARRGHRIAQLPEGYTDFGCGQLIWRLDDGYAAASDARRDSLAVGF